MFSPGSQHVLEHREPPKQAVDLEGASNAELDALCLAVVRDVAAPQPHFPAGRMEDPGQEVDERRLPRPVGADERVPRPRLEAEVDVAHGRERTEGQAEAARLEQQLAHEPLRDGGRRAIISPRPSMPFLAKSAITTSRSPSPSCQAVG